jgi:HEAT repeat protein
VTFGELLHALRAAADRGVDFRDIEDDIEFLAEHEPGTSRAGALAHTGDEQMRIWALGLIADPRDHDRIVAALEDPELRFTALEALGNQRDRDHTDRIARTFLADPDPLVRSKAAGLVIWLRRPGFLEALLPLTADPDRDVRSVITLKLGIRPDPAAESLLRVLADDADDRIRRSATRALERLTRRG